MRNETLEFLEAVLEKLASLQDEELLQLSKNLNRISQVINFEKGKRKTEQQSEQTIQAIINSYEDKDHE